MMMMMMFMMMIREGCINNGDDCDDDNGDDDKEDNLEHLASSRSRVAAETHLIGVGINIIHFYFHLPVFLASMSSIIKNVSFFYRARKHFVTDL